MNTRLLIRPVSDIRILDTQFIDGGLVGLLVDDLYQLDIQVGDTLSLSFDEKSINTQYNGNHQVLAVGSGGYPCCSTDPQNTIVMNIPWGGSTFLQGGFIKNIIRDGISIRFQTIDLDLKEEFQFPLTYNLVDIRSPQNRKSDFSKTITLPGTKHNNKILESIFEIGADSHFNPNLRKDIIVLNDGLEVFTGFMKLEKIFRNEWEEITYEVKISGRLLDLFSKLVNTQGDDLRLEDLSFNEYNHLKVKETILDSWNGVIQKNGSDYNNYIVGPTFSVIDTNFDGGRTKFILTGAPSGLNLGDVVRFTMDNPGDLDVNFDQSQGHHTIIDVGTNSVSVNLDFRSGATNSGVLEKWESKGEGYVYPTINFNKQAADILNWEPEDFQTHFYLKTIIDKIFNYINFEYESNFFNSDFFKRLIIPYEDYGLDSELFINFVSTGSSVASQGVETNLPFVNVINNSNWVVDTTNRIYTSLVSKEFDFQFDMSGNISNYFSGNLRYMDIILYTEYNPITNSTDPNWATGTGYQASIKRAFQVSGQPAPGNYQGGTNNDDINTSLRLSPTGGFFFTTFINFRGIKILQNTSFRIKVLFVRNPSNTSFLAVSNCNLKNTEVNIEREIKARDLLTSIISMFNLYIETDFFNPRKVIIEPYRDFYIPNGSKDWSKKLDLSKPVEIEPTSSNISKNFEWTYKDDGDFLNKDYKDNYGETYGRYSYISETQFNTNTSKFEVAFSQTPLIDINRNGDLIIPTIVKDNQFVRQDKYNVRIYYWTGIRWIFQFNIGGVSTGNDFDVPVYGYAGHFDNPKDATLDLNFGFAKKYYYGEFYPFYITENTLYYKFYKDYIDEITDKNSKLLRGYFKLNSSDINGLTFRRFYYIDNVLYRLQSIIDYDPMKKDPTLCEFVKVNKSLVSFNYKRVNPTIKGELIKNPVQVGGTGTTPGVIQVGSGNFIGPYTSGLIIGNGNVIEGSVENAFVFGNNLSITQSNTIQLGGLTIENEEKWISAQPFNNNLGGGFYGGIPGNPNFGTGGVVAIEFDSVGNILVAGFFTFFNGNTRNYLVRLNSDGTEDAAFYTNLGTGFSLQIFTIKIQSDGKILVGGDFTTFNGNTRNRLVRLNSDGTEDTTFYINMGTAFNGSITNLLIEPSGSILVSGEHTTFNGVSVGRLIRLNNDGTRDVTFNPVFDNRIYDIKQLQSGDYIAVGEFTNFGPTDYIRIFDSFGSQIIPVNNPDINNLGWRCTIQPDGKIVIIGDFTTLNGNTRNGYFRLNTDFSEDVDFYTNSGGNGITDALDDVAFIGDKIFIVGAFTTFNGNPREGIICLDLDGTENIKFYEDTTSLSTGISPPIFPALIGGNSNFRKISGFDNQVFVGGIFPSSLGGLPRRFVKFELNNVSSSGIDTLTIQNVLKLTPRSADPPAAGIGDIYYRQGVGPKFFDGSLWRTISFT